MGTEFREDQFGGLARELLDVRGAQPDVLIGGGQGAVRRCRRGAARNPMRAEQDDDFRVAVQGGRVASGPAGRRAARGAPGRHARSFKVRNTSADVMSEHERR